MSTPTLRIALATATGSAVLETSVPQMNIMSMGGDSGCKLAMLLNWHVIDSCFLSAIFHIRSSFAFFLTCLASVSLVISLEYLRRVQRKFDNYLRTKNDFLQNREYVVVEDIEKELGKDDGNDKHQEIYKMVRRVKLTIALEQFTRGFIHMLQFATSYCIMLMFMYCNGYIIISILIGALIGFALFTRDTLRLQAEK